MEMTESLIEHVGATKIVSWTEKYRPLKLSEVYGHKKIRHLLENASKHGCVKLPPLILYGPPGTGKTSIALALASETYPDVPSELSSLYLNASDERSIEVIRERILQFSHTIWPGVTRKFVIFDEVETMTEPAQASLRALLDEVDAEGHTNSPLYLFLCNSLYRVHPAIRSRCVSLFCGHIPIHSVTEALTNIQKEEKREKIRLPTEVTFKLQRGDMRSFVAAIQSNGELNVWDKWLERLILAGTNKNSFAVWDDGLKKAPFSVLIRHVFLYMDLKGHLTSCKKTELEQFIKLTMILKDSNNSVLLSTIPGSWEACF
jgi:DNA polymerase III delta prime subunit